MTLLENILEKVIFAGRWLLAPLYIGLLLALVPILYRFFHAFWHLITHMQGATAGEITLQVLELLDTVFGKPVNAGDTENTYDDAFDAAAVNDTDTPPAGNTSGITPNPDNTGFGGTSHTWPRRNASLAYDKRSEYLAVGRYGLSYLRITMSVAHDTVVQGLMSRHAPASRPLSSFQTKRSCRLRSLHGLPSDRANA